MFSSNPVTTINNSIFSSSVCSESNKFYRRSMEDSHSLLLDFADILGSGYFAIFDGHAGKKAAKLASTMLGTLLDQPFKCDSHSPDQISSAISSIFVSFNEELCTSLLDDNSGCTALVAIFCPDQTNDDIGHIYVANLGDSLGILSTNHTYRLLSAPHNCSTESSLVHERGGFVYGSRVNGILAVTRAFGNIHLKPYLSASPSVFHESFSLSNPPHSLVLACDGEAVKVVMASSSSAEAVESLVKYAVDNNSTDNITCIVVSFNNYKAL
ncbi:protein phosphatase 2C Ptc1 [Mitosporidium daphniae]|uniref:Protein phosphatase 2C Ptc1 n=1 Tax=Mitosporidium daphniae TaxID=1485682 RepID=A0A098VME6_9MICR|nr:protein phosphatase 2C Ptc1 [Mitosporidium daphniae]KGG49954.1 protein phosphatase 2C Ptc1 [Mitosporidium daphniae]|eukprot:XP_013236381.1 protein phosphatase 2C Ptc1 [Mitosporidium daphniae]